MGQLGPGRVCINNRNRWWPRVYVAGFVMLLVTAALLTGSMRDTAAATALPKQTHWGGFMDEDVTHANLHGAVGTWTVPSVTCAPNENSAVAVWVGTGGDIRTKDGQETLYQDGTTSACHAGSPIYYAWQQQFGAPNLAQQAGLSKHYKPALVLGCKPGKICFAVSIRPQDQISASIVDRGIETHWSIDDIRNGRRIWAHSSIWRTDFQHKHSSECIVEDPERFSTNGGLIPFSQFGRVVFTTCEAIDQSGHIWNINSPGLPKHWKFSELSVISNYSAVAIPSEHPLAVTRVGTVPTTTGTTTTTGSTQSVSLAALCTNSLTEDNAQNGCPYVGSTTVNSSTFNYAVLVKNNNQSVLPSIWDLVDFRTTTCSSVDLTFGLPDNGGQPGDRASIEVVSGSGVPQAATTTYGQIRTLHANLGNGIWSIRNAATRSSDQIAINGVAACSSSNGN